MNEYTVIAFYEDNGQLIVEHFEAETVEQAPEEAEKLLSGIERQGYDVSNDYVILAGHLETVANNHRAINEDWHRSTPKNEESEEFDRILRPDRIN